MESVESKSQSLKIEQNEGWRLPVKDAIIHYRWQLRNQSLKSQMHDSRDYDEIDWTNQFILDAFGQLVIGNYNKTQTIGQFRDNTAMLYAYSWIVWTKGELI
tara:strand:- start:8689 stop:8994 length:306 start_codon:yes stop_codon:yes gene_type:complete